MREEIVNAFQKCILPYKDGFQVEKETDQDTDEESTLVNEEDEENEGN